MTGRHVNRALALGMFAFGLGLMLNSLLGPLGLAVFDYPFSETVRNETLGLDAVSALLVAPVALSVGVLALREHRATWLLALGPTAYGAYMLIQYVVGPQYQSYQPWIPLQLALFVLSASLLLHAWTHGDELDGGQSWGWAFVSFGLAAFVLSRWLSAFAGMPGNEPVPAARPDLTMYWVIFFLDLGIVVPAAVATGVGLLTGSRWASRALYGLVGWFALVPPSVAAMSVAKVLRGDPNAATGDTIVFIVATGIFWLIAYRLFRPLFTPPTNDRHGLERPLVKGPQRTLARERS